jgi:hypothetical protein
MIKLIDFFTLVKTKEATYEWILANHNPEIAPEDALAELLAIKLMEHRLRGCPSHFKEWEQSYRGEKPLSPKVRAAIVAFTEPVFGPVGVEDAIPSDHLEGLVSQYLWYFLCMEMPSDPIVKDIPPGFKATDPGGDALMIHKIDEKYLMFRLWEIKKFVSNDPKEPKANPAITRAYEQLASKATEYLARYTSIGQELGPELKDFFGQLVDLWEDASPQASAGVSINTSVKHIPENAFHDFGAKFPAFADPIRLQGMFSAVNDFSDFSKKVRRGVWKGL